MSEFRVARDFRTVGGISGALIGRLMIGIVVSAALCEIAHAAPADRPPALMLEATIALPNTSGRIDHLAIDLTRKLLFVAELGNGSVDVIDLDRRKVVHRIAGLQEPQGIVYVPKSDLLAIASGGDGTVRIFSAGDFSPHGVITLGDDADNLRLDPRSGNIVVGYGAGHLAVIDPVKAVKLKDIPLPAHPESFQLSPSDSRVYVNVPDSHHIAIADLNAGTVVASWPTPHLAANFPLALGCDGIVAVVFRSPARMARFDLRSGQVVTANATCGDADDIFFDAKRQRYYVSCGAGVIDVFQVANGAVAPIAPVPTSPGARTSIFVPELDRLLLAVRAGLLGTTAAIQIFHPTP